MVIYASEDIEEGQEVFLGKGLQEMATVDQIDVDQ